MRGRIDDASGCRPAADGGGGMQERGDARVRGVRIRGDQRRDRAFRRSSPRRARPPRAVCARSAGTRVGQERDCSRRRRCERRDVVDASVGIACELAAEADRELTSKRVSPPWGCARLLALAASPAWRRRGFGRRRRWPCGLQRAQHLRRDVHGLVDVQHAIADDQVVVEVRAHRPALPAAASAAACRAPRCGAGSGPRRTRSACAPARAGRRAGPSRRCGARFSAMTAPSFCSLSSRALQVLLLRDDLALARRELVLQRLHRRLGLRRFLQQPRNVDDADLRLRVAAPSGAAGAGGQRTNSAKGHVQVLMSHVESNVRTPGRWRTGNPRFRPCTPRIAALVVERHGVAEPEHAQRRQPLHGRPADCLSSS